MPGNITSPLSSGCNALLKQGAHPVTCTEDILEVIAPQYIPKQSILPLGTTPLETKIPEMLPSGICDGDELQQLSGVTSSEFSQAITIMEINGKLRGLGANQWAAS